MAGSRVAVELLLLPAILPNHMNFLDTVIVTKKKELYNLKREKPLAQMQREALSLEGRRQTRSLREAILKAQPVAVMAEIKRQSPSEGMLTALSHIEIARLYAESEADAVSVLTDKTYFLGDISYVPEVKSIVRQPVFRKDFIIDPYQIYETFMACADAFLLMASLLSAVQLKALLLLGASLNLESMVEVHNKQELENALEAGTEIIGINNRNLKTLRVDTATTETLLPLIPREKIVVSESGIYAPEQVRTLARLGVRGVLVGTAVLKSKNPVEKISELKRITL